MKLFSSLPSLLCLVGILSVADGTPIERDGFYEDVPNSSVWAFKPQSAGWAESKRAKENCDNILDICAMARNNDPSYIRLKESCNLFNVSDFFTDTTLDSENEFTIFIPTNRAINRLFTEQYEFGRNELISINLIRDIMRNHIIKGTKLGSRDIICSDELNVLNEDEPKPYIQCKEDIAGNPATYIYGKGNSKPYIPRFENPIQPIETCKQNIFVIEDAILNQRPPKYTIPPSTGSISSIKPSSRF